MLVDRSERCRSASAWPVKYTHGLFHMTSDSHLFHTATHLEEEGFYPVEGNRSTKGEELYLPLYEGKTVQEFDHRAASITNRELITCSDWDRPDRTLDDDHRDPNSHRVHAIALASRQYCYQGDSIGSWLQRHHGVNQCPNDDCRRRSPGRVWTRHCRSFFHPQTASILDVQPVFLPI